MTATAARSASWISLVAATTLGVREVRQVRTRVSIADDLGEGDLRLIVQSYRRDKLDGKDHPREFAEPLASAQRAITAEELRNGVDVRFLQLPAEGSAAADSVVVAWVEQGAPTLDFDGLEARPANGAYYGVAQRAGGDIVLRLARG